MQNTDADMDGEGSNWCLSALAEHLEREDVPWACVWKQVRDIVAKTLLLVEAKFTSRTHRTIKNFTPSTCYSISSCVHGSLRQTLAQPCTALPRWTSVSKPAWYAIF